MTALHRRAPSRMTVAEFLQWDGGDPTGGRWQLIDGEPAAMAPASQTRSYILSEPAGRLRNHLLELASPRVGAEPGVVPRTGAHENWRIPDLAVTCSTDLSSHMMQDPVLLVEVLSRATTPNPSANVRAYTTIPSVMEILVVHTVRMQAELLRRGADGSWPATPSAVRLPDILELASVGLSVPVAALYRTTGLA